MSDGPDDGNEGHGGSAPWFCVMTVAVIGASISTGGYMVQKIAHQQDIPDEWPYWTKKDWIAGFLIMLGGNALCYVVQGLASQSLLSSLHCWNVILVFVVAPYIFGETPSRHLLCGAALLAFGAMLIVFKGPHEYSPEAEVKALSQGSWQNRKFFTVVFVLLFILFAVLLRAILRKRSRGPDSTGPDKAIRRGISSSKTFTSCYMKPIELILVSSILSSFAVLCSKITATVSVNILETQNLGSWKAMYVCLYLLGGSIGLCNLHCMNMALRASTCIFVLPTQNLFSMLGQVATCATFFGEFQDKGIKDKFSFWFGVLVCVVGTCVIVLAPRDDGESSDEGDPEEEIPLARGEKDGFSGTLQ